MTEYAFDGEGFAEEYQLGDTVPGTLIVNCLAGDDACLLGGAFDGEPAVEIAVDVVADGLATYESRSVSDTCDGGQALTREVDVAFGPAGATANDAFVYEPRTCDHAGGTQYGTDITWSFTGSLIGYTAPPDEGEPSENPVAASPSPEAPTPAEPTGGGSAVDDESGMPFAASVPSPGEVSTDPMVLLQSAPLAALLVFLMPFPSQLFNSTLEAHEDEVRRWLRLDRLGASAAASVRSGARGLA